MARTSHKETSANLVSTSSSSEDVRPNSSSNDVRPVFEPSSQLHDDDGMQEKEADASLPLSAEYFGVAIALCTLCGLEGFSFSGTAESPKITVRELLKAAHARLLLLIWKSRVLEEKVKQRPVVDSDELWQIERSQFMHQIQQLQLDLHELRRKREEDGRANEKVVSIFSTREQTWKAERKKLVCEQRRLWHELQRSLITQEALHLKVNERMRQGHCDECDRRERLLEEFKDRLGEQEILIMATMEEAKAEQQEKNDLTKKLLAMEELLSEQKDNLLLEVKGRAEDHRKHETAMELLEARLRRMESEHTQYHEDLLSAQSSNAALLKERERCEDLISQMSLEVSMLQKAAKEKDPFIAAMIKNADRHVQEMHDAQRELVIVKAKQIHAEGEKEKWKRLVEGKMSTCAAKEGLKPRTSIGSRGESGFDMVVELQKLHDIEIHHLRSAFEDEVKLLQRRLSAYQEKVAELEKGALDDDKQMTSLPHGKCLISLANDKHIISSEEEENNTGIIVLNEQIAADMENRKFQISVAKTFLKQYVDSNAQREQEVESWKKLYFASKATFKIFYKNQGYLGSMPKNPKLHDLLEMEKAWHASKVEQRHWQEIKAFERQLKARDERMEAFRWQLLSMQNEAQNRLCEINSLKENILTLENTLKERESELVTLKEIVVVEYEQKIQMFHDEILALKSTLIEREVGYELSLAKLLAVADSEMQDKNCRLADLEAQLVRAHMLHEKEKR